MTNKNVSIFYTFVALDDYIDEWSAKHKERIIRIINTYKKISTW